MRTIPIGNILLGILYVNIAAAILAAVVFVVGRPNALRVSLGGDELVVVVANTPELQEKGLSGHRPLGAREGMLFVFPQPVRSGFWMKDMSFPIDIIWFNENRQIVDVWENASPNSYPEIRGPKNDALYVLEAPSGFFASHKLSIGDVLELGAPARYTK